jgi:hypothetical protein
MALHLLDLVESLAELREIGSPVPESSRALQVLTSGYELLFLR